MLSFNRKILIIGYGSVSQCALPILFQQIEIPYERVTVIDFVDQRNSLKEWINKGVHYFQEKITPETLDNILSKYVEPGGAVIDLAWNIDCIEMLRWCHDHQVLYLNTSVEEWNPFEDIHNKTPLRKSLYWRQMCIRELIASWGSGQSSVTAVVDHGANPGLISHFTKQGIVDIAEKSLKDNLVSPEKIKHIENGLETLDFARLAMNLDIKVIHCSERDQQITDHPKKVDEFVGTWSIEGLIEEGMAPAEMGWGTHEKKLPEYACVPEYGPKNQIFLPQMGMNTWVRSWVPSQEIIGMVIRHGEAFGISDKLTVWEKEKAVYRPTVHYAYMPCHETLASLYELRGRGYRPQPEQRIMSDEITEGEDILGALIMGHPYQSWWTGSILSINESRKLIPHQNATTVQVAIGVISAFMWMIENPKKGFCLPDDLPHDFILKIAKPYLGQFVSQDYNWTPETNYQVFFKENPKNVFDKDNLWAFENFLFRG